VLQSVGSDPIPEGKAARLVARLCLAFVAPIDCNGYASNAS